MDGPPPPPQWTRVPTKWLREVLEDLETPQLRADGAYTTALYERLLRAYEETPPIDGGVVEPWLFIPPPGAQPDKHEPLALELVPGVPWVDFDEEADPALTDALIDDIDVPPNTYITRDTPIHPIMGRTFTRSPDGVVTYHDGRPHDYLPPWVRDLKQMPAASRTTAVNRVFF